MAGLMINSIHFAFAIILGTLVCFSNVGYGIEAETVIDSPLLTQKIDTNRTIKVDIDGKGDFKSVQAAIDSVPVGNNEWVIIHIRKGNYRYVPS